MRGCFRNSRSITTWTIPAASASGHPIRSSPAVGSARKPISLMPWFNSLKTAIPHLIRARPYGVGSTDRKSTRLNSSHTVIYTLSLHDALPICRWIGEKANLVDALVQFVEDGDPAFD